MSTSGNNEDGVACPTSGRNTKKVWFKENEDNITEMIVDPVPAKTVSWKDFLLGNYVESMEGIRGDDKENFDFE
ncbi:hypothetical protein Goarm_017058 [Gossypium armourianum]|uniref:Uncharacterized protein n=1 Tax=Gossypium armourianum TaxID=34283 RepID=A0A7J9JE65_9ROSI|nr:hypothetical protein [Gossypium armourianum]